MDYFDSPRAGSAGDRLRTQLLTAANDLKQLQAFLDNLRRSTNADAALFRFLDMTDLSYPITVTSGDGVFTQAFFDEYDGGMVQHDPQVSFALDFKLRRYSIYVCHERYSEEDRQKMDYFSTFLPRHNIKWFAGYLAQFDKTFGAGFGVARGPDKPHFSEDDKAILEGLSPILEDWASVFFNSQRSKLVINAMNAALTSRPNFAACLDAQGRLLWKDANADEHLKQIKGLINNNDALSAQSSSPGETFLSTAKQTARKTSVLADQTLQTPAASFKFETEDGREYEMDFEPVYANKEGSAKNGLKGCLILGKDLRTAQTTNSAAMAPPTNEALNSLSKKEMEVAQQIASGLKVKEVAAKLNIKTETARTHIKRIYKKLNINSRHELTSLILARSPDNHDDA